MLVAACVVALAAVPAQASSIVYLDANHNVWVTSPDGATKRQITTNGDTLKYASPSETDSGTIVAPGYPRDVLLLQPRWQLGGRSLGCSGHELLLNAVRGQ